MALSKLNNWNAPLAAFGFPGDVFTGKAEATAGAAISVNIFVSTHCTLTIEQSYNTSNWYYSNQLDISAGQILTLQVPVVMPNFRVNLLNEEQVTQTYCNMNTSFVPQLTQNFNIRHLNAATDSVSTNIDLSGVTLSVGTTVDVGNFPSVQTVDGAVSVLNFPSVQTVDGAVSVLNLPLDGNNYLLTNDVSGNLVMADMLVALKDISNNAVQVVAGQEVDYIGFATPATNLPAVYADGIPGVNVTGGWSYTSTLVGTPPFTGSRNKINWYLYYSATPDTDFSVSQINNVYAVINQKSTLGAQAQLPFFVIYTRPDSGVNNGGTFYKNKLVFGGFSFVGTQGMMLLYTGEDPVGIHPEITGANRYKLEFNAGGSTATLAAASGEGAYLASLQTDSQAKPNGTRNFVFSEFSMMWDKTPIVLPISQNQVQVFDKGLNTLAADMLVALRDISNNVVVFPSVQDISGTVIVSRITDPLPAGTNILGAVHLTGIYPELDAEVQGSMFQFDSTPASGGGAIGLGLLGASIVTMDAINGGASVNVCARDDAYQGESQSPYTAGQVYLSTRYTPPSLQNPTCNAINSLHTWVDNFPTVPAVQDISGSVVVSNLPLDANNYLRTNDVSGNLLLTDIDATLTNLENKMPISQGIQIYGSSDPGLPLPLSVISTPFEASSQATHLITRTKAVKGADLYDETNINSSAVMYGNTQQISGAGNLQPIPLKYNYIDELTVPIYSKAIYRGSASDQELNAIVSYGYCDNRAKPLQQNIDGQLLTNDISGNLLMETLIADLSGITITAGQLQVGGTVAISNFPAGGSEVTVVSALPAGSNVIGGVNINTRIATAINYNSFDPQYNSYSTPIDMTEYRSVDVLVVPYNVNNPDTETGITLVVQISYNGNDYGTLPGYSLNFKGSGPPSLALNDIKTNATYLRLAALSANNPTTMSIDTTVTMMAKY